MILHEPGDCEYRWLRIRFQSVLCCFKPPLRHFEPFRVNFDHFEDEGLHGDGYTRPRLITHKLEAREVEVLI